MRYLNLPELEEVSENLYKNTVHPIILVDNRLDICWANSEALKRFPTLAIPGGFRDLVDSYDFDKIISVLRSGRTFLASTVVEPFNEFAIRIIPIISEEGLVGSQVFFRLEGFDSKDCNEDTSEKIMSNFSNEYRMPLTIIFSTLGLIARRLSEKQDDTMKAYLKLVTQNCYRLLRLSNNMTEIMKYRAGLNMLHLKNGDICQFTEGLCKAAGILTGAAGVKLSYHLPKQNIITAFDPAKLSVVFFNLFSNSCKYTQEGNQIKVKLEQRDRQVVITIADQGMGVSNDIIDRIFEPYFSFNPNGNPFGGAGLGLTLARYIVLQHGGTIAVKSREGEGTTVAFVLPIRQVGDIPDYTAEKSVDYLSDRFSMLYVELSDVCGCPMP